MVIQALRISLKRHAVMKTEHITSDEVKWSIFNECLNVNEDKCYEKVNH